MDNILYFAANDQNWGTELHKIEFNGIGLPTAEMVYDLYPGDPLLLFRVMLEKGLIPLILIHLDQQMDGLS